MTCDEQIEMSADSVFAKTPSLARIYDCYLGGTSHFPADSEVAGKVLAAVPYGRKLAKANRKFVTRAAHLMARRGISQFLDLGCGLPTEPNIHDTVRSVRPDAVVLYVDDDRDVAINPPALTGGSGANFMRADISHPYNLLAKAEGHQLIDLSQPVGVLLGAVLHFIPWEKVHLLISTLVEEIAEGSYLAISHVTSTDTDPKAQAVIEAAYTATSSPVVFRKRHEIREFFNGLHLIKPWLVEVDEWRGNGQAAPARSYAVKFPCGVARKP